MKKVLFILALVMIPTLALAQDVMAIFNTQDFILQLVATGGAAMVISGWISAKFTQASGIAAQIQAILVAIALTAIAALLHLVPMSISDYWAWLKAGVANGIISNLIYKSGIFNNLLVKIQALSAHQTAQKQ